MSYSGKNQFIGAPDQFGIVSHNYISIQVLERLSYRCEVARLIVDDGDHRSPLVLGSIFARRLSLEQATRRARAKALNRASSLW